MESLPKNELLEFAPNALENIRKLYGLDKPGKMTEAIDIVLDWAKAQNHFQRADFPRNLVEVMIIVNKGSLERTKQRLEKLCTYRTLMPNFYGPYNIKTDFKEVNAIASLILLPKMTDDYYRIMMFRGKGDTFLPKMYTQYYRSCRLICEYAMAYDYSVGFVLIYDMREMNLVSFLSNVNLMEFRQAALLCFEGFGMRMKGIHILSQSKMIDTFVKLLQQVLSSKLGARIRVHKSEESLYNEIPKDYLPQEYGGKEKLMNGIMHDMHDFYGSEEFVSYMAKRDTFGVNEKSREKDFITTEYMGLPGTFRSLTVD